MQHYGLARIRSSLVHFVIGKGMGAFASVAFIFFLANALNKADYAALVTVQALVLVAGVLFSFGVNQSLIRFVPELRASNNNAALYRLINGSVLTRLGVLGIGMGVLGTFIAYIAPYLQLDRLTDVLWIYMVVGWFRVVNLFFVRVLESLLWQKISQYALAGGGLLKIGMAMLLAAYLSDGEAVTLLDVFFIELGAEAFTFFVLFIGYQVQKSKDPDKDKGEVSWIAKNIMRIRRYGFWAFLTSLTMIAWGSGPNRLVAAKLLPSDIVATYGFADALASLAKRLMPATMLHGMIRPIMVARFSNDRRFASLAEQGNLNFRINLVVLSIPMLVVALGGEWLFGLLTSGNYPEAGTLLAAMIGVTVLDGLRMQTEMACDVVELNDRSMLGNLVLAMSLALAFILVPLMGVWGMIVASFIGEVASVALMIFLLRRAGHHWVGDMNSLLAILYLALAMGSGVVVNQFALASAWVDVVAAVAAFMLLLVMRPPVSDVERLLFKKLLHRST